MQTIIFIKIIEGAFLERRTIFRIIPHFFQPVFYLVAKWNFRKIILGNLIFFFHPRFGFGAVIIFKPAIRIFYNRSKVIILLITFVSDQDILSANKLSVDRDIREIKIEIFMSNIFTDEDNFSFL